MVESDAATTTTHQTPVRVPGLGSDPEKKALLSAAAKVVDSTPAIGTEILGLQLADLSEQQLDELARLIGERGVVFFRDQTTLTPEVQTRIARFWGSKVHTRAPVGNVNAHPELQSIRADANSKQVAGGQRWHQDHPASPEPGSLTFLHIFETPPNGGDTVWSSLYGAYDRLSPAFRKLIDGLETLQEGLYYPQDESYEPERAIHPLVATHPVTGWRYLSVNGPYLKQIRGFKKTESDALLSYLNGVPEKSLDLQVRFKWEKNSVAIWDNRVVIHHPVWDYFPHVRAGSRFVVLGPTKPAFDPASPTRNEALGIVPAPFVFADVANEIEDIKGRNKEGVRFVRKEA
ncbi:alpha-ketoglutarate-dependent taurine dioxygenase [Zopfochytrium polystomum]|nr:alpha-ketoglutarate-dependent taurine dioxygenase [Zopfochytrium polystomum]